MTDTFDPFEAADRLAPLPDRREAPTSAWVRHYAALALAAHAVFRANLDTLRAAAPGSRPDLGYLMLVATSATAAAAALHLPRNVPGHLWDLTPECGALNGEDIDWLAETLAGLGVNPADIYRWYEAADFTVTGGVV